MKSMNAIEEISRLRLHQASLDSSKNWTLSSTVLLIAILFPTPPEGYELYAFSFRVLVLFILGTSIAFLFLSGKQKTGLSRKQLKLLGFSEFNLILTSDTDLSLKTPDGTSNKGNPPTVDISPKNNINNFTSKNLENLEKKKKFPPFIKNKIHQKYTIFRMKNQSIITIIMILIMRKNWPNLYGVIYPKIL
mmetsp:Transcript_17945/g.17261  ORF Transcript_17945/g.17261 Transcript_17945/m.17261 type:complete len:191 (+) Transcript_17945:180-752(+)